MYGRKSTEAAAATTAAPNMYVGIMDGLSWAVKNKHAHTDRARARCIIGDALTAVKAAAAKASRNDRECGGHHHR